MKILHVIPSLNSAGGGPVEGLKQLVVASMNMGHLVEVAVLDVPGAVWLEGLPFRVHALGPHVSSYGYSSRLIPWLRKYAETFDAVIVEGLWMYHGYAVRKVLRKAKVPYFVFTHGMLAPWFKNTYPLKHLKKWLYWPWGEYRVLRDAKAVLFTSEEERIHARESFWLYKCNEVVVGYGTVVPSGNSGQQRAAFYARNPHLQGKRILLFVGRIHEIKGCDILIEAFAKVADSHPDLHLVIAGPDHAGLQKELVAISEKLGIADQLTWTGMISGDVKWGAYYASEVFVLPSHHENFGVVVAEALACNLPVLISNKVNIWREIESEGAGLVADDTLEGTVELMRRWLDMSGAEFSQIKEKTRPCFEKRFNMLRTAKRLLEIIQELR